MTFLFELYRTERYKNQSEKNLVDFLFLKSNIKIIPKGQSIQLIMKIQFSLLFPKKDIDFINQIKQDKEYQERTKTWKDYTRQEQSELVMKYVDDIELALVGNEVVKSEWTLKSFLL